MERQVAHPEPPDRSDFKASQRWWAEHIASAPDEDVEDDAEPEA
jgi:hypothetical protein